MRRIRIAIRILTYALKFTKYVSIGRSMEELV